MEPLEELPLVSVKVVVCKLLIVKHAHQVLFVLPVLQEPLLSTINVPPVEPLFPIVLPVLQQSVFHATVAIICQILTPVLLA